MRSSVLLILLAFSGALHAETLQEIATGLPIGTTKEEIARLALDSPNQVALITSTERGKELWIVDESVFDSKAFFMEPTTDNKNKLLKSKEAIDAQRKSYKETR